MCNFLISDSVTWEHTTVWNPDTAAVQEDPMMKIKVSIYLYETLKNGAGIIVWWVWNNQAWLGGWDGNQDSVNDDAWAVCRMAFSV